MAEARVSITHLTPTEFGHVLVLKESKGERVFAIQLSHQDYVFLELALEGRTTSHGTPHDTMKGMMVALCAIVEKVVISEPEVRDSNNDLCVATIYILKDGHSLPIGARPVDAIALAVKTDCPILLEDGIFEKVISYPENKAEETSETDKGKGTLDWLAKLDHKLLVSH